MNLSKLQEIVKVSEPGVLHSMGSQRVGYDLATEQQAEGLSRTHPPNLWAQPNWFIVSTNYTKGEHKWGKWIGGKPRSFQHLHAGHQTVISWFHRPARGQCILELGSRKMSYHETISPAKVVVDKLEQGWLPPPRAMRKQAPCLSLGSRLIGKMTFKDPRDPGIQDYTQTSHSEFSACRFGQHTGRNLFSGWSPFWLLIHSTLHAPFPARPGPSFSLPLWMTPKPSPGFRTGVPNLLYLMHDGLRQSWCNNRNKVHNKCETLESSWNHHPPPHPTPLPISGKTVSHKTGPWCLKG